MRIIFDLFFACPRCGHKLKHKYIDHNDANYNVATYLRCPECGSYLHYCNSMVQEGRHLKTYSYSGIPCVAWINLWKNSYQLVEGFETCNCFEGAHREVPLIDWVNCYKSHLYFKPDIGSRWFFDDQQINYAIQFIRYRNIFEKARDYVSFKKEVKCNEKDYSKRGTDIYETGY